MSLSDSAARKRGEVMGISFTEAACGQFKIVEI
jgi:hypothetical protein